MTDETNQIVIFPDVRPKAHIPEFAIYLAMSFMFLLHAIFTTYTAPKSYSDPAITEITKPIAAALNTLHASRFVCTQLNGHPQAYLTIGSLTYSLYNTDSKIPPSLKPLEAPCPSQFQLTVHAAGSSEITYTTQTATLTTVIQEWDAFETVVRSQQAQAIARYLVENAAYFSSRTPIVFDQIPATP